MTGVVGDGPSGNLATGVHHDLRLPFLVGWWEDAPRLDL